MCPSQSDHKEDDYNKQTHNKACDQQDQQGWAFLYIVLYLQIQK